MILSEGIFMNFKLKILKLNEEQIMGYDKADDIMSGLAPTADVFAQEAIKVLQATASQNFLRISGDPDGHRCHKCGDKIDPCRVRAFREEFGSDPAYCYKCQSEVDQVNKRNRLQAFRSGRRFIS